MLTAIRLSNSGAACASRYGLHDTICTFQFMLNQQLNDATRKSYRALRCNTSRRILSTVWIAEFLAGAASEACPVASEAVFLCLQTVSARLAALLLYLSLASAAEQLLSLALSGWVAVMARDLCHQQHINSRVTSERRKIKNHLCVYTCVFILAIIYNLKYTFSNIRGRTDTPTKHCRQTHNAHK